MLHDDLHAGQLDPTAYRDALRLPPPGLTRLLDALDAKPVPPGVADRRRSIRVAFRPDRPGLLTVRHVDGSSARCRVALRNLSKRGAGFLHGGFVHIGAAVTLAVTDLDGRYIEFTGHTVRCRLIGAHVHEAAVVFDRGVPMDRFVPDPPIEEDDGAAGPRPLGGKVLIVDGGRNPDARTLREAAAGSKTEFHAAETPCEARKQLTRHAFDLIVADPRRLGGAVEVMTAWLADHGSTAQLALLLTEADRRLEVAALGAGCVAALHRPLRGDDAAALLRAALPDHVEADLIEPMHCTLWHDPVLRPVITDYAARAVARGNQLVRVLRAGDYRAAFTLCLDLKANAASHGFAELTREAAELLQSIVTELGEHPGRRACLVETAQRITRRCIAAQRFVSGVA